MPDYGHRLEPKLNQAGISTAAPPTLACQLQSLPAILHKLRLDSMSSCSKAPRGLLVLVRTDGIFTANARSPSPSLRQCPDRYAIRAGRNLPDKEFRYLRTVIVTAAVHWGFSSALARLPLTFQHWAGVSSYTSCCHFAETCVFGKQLEVSFLCGPLARAPLLPKLRGHFAEFLNVSSPVPLSILNSPTCVGLRYGQLL